MNPMIGIIPIMGVGQRFKDAGFTTPKHLLEVSPGVTILEKIISTFNGEPIYIGCRPEYYEDIVKIVKAGEYNVHVYSLNYSILSSIETTLMLLDHVYCDYQPIVVHYCDVFLPEGLDILCEKTFLYHSAGMISVDTKDERFTRDKTYNKAIGGIYWFRSKSDLIFKIKSNSKSKTIGEIVQSDGYWMVDANQIDIGTPEAYREYLEAQNERGR
jgi:hypothetical protein